jgi:hypothetical protein
MRRRFEGEEEAVARAKEAISAVTRSTLYPRAETKKKNGSWLCAAKEG